MWYACSSHLKPETKSICTLRYDTLDLLWKHLAANMIYYRKISEQYEIFEDEELRYTINISDFPFERSRLLGLIIGSIIIGLAIAGVVWLIIWLTS